MKKLLVLLLLSGCTVVGQDRNPEADVRQTLSQFIQAFDNLDRARFADFFANDATMFQPRKFPKRAENKAEIETEFRQVFEIIRGNQSKPPYMDLQPLDLRIQILTADVAIATFHLDDRAGVLNRRTLVLQRFKSGWQIVHIHASEVALPSANGARQD
jgi:ketosteroid isomerase-like protein